MADTAIIGTEGFASHLQQVVAQLRSIAIRALARMYRPREHLFAFRIRRTPDGDVLEGVSRRYTAVALIGLTTQPDEIATSILAGQSTREMCGHLLEEISGSTDLGEPALALWAARSVGHPDASKVLHRLKSLDPVSGSWPTLELAWSLTALTVPGHKSDAGDDGSSTDKTLADSIARRLLSSFSDRSCLFAHWPQDASSRWVRRHVSCFADLVYPIQALSYYHRATGNPDALEAAHRCAQRMCQLQGPAGQWWWYYDVRTGRVVERYPVYSVHQDAMGPMALFAVLDACRAKGRLKSASADPVQPLRAGDTADTTISSPSVENAIARGLSWMSYSPEISGSLIDDQADLVWRKVARREPGKVSRRLQAVASRIHPSFRVPGLGWLLPPIAVDYECRPYHMGWILHAWQTKQTLQGDIFRA